MAKSSIVLSAILLLIFSHVITEIAKVNGQLCERESQTYSGIVCHPHKCDRKCISWEKATHGACHLREWKSACYCYYEGDCSKLPPPSGGAAGGGGSKGDGGGSGGGAGGGKGGGGTGSGSGSSGTGGSGTGGSGVGTGGGSGSGSGGTGGGGSGAGSGSGTGGTGGSGAGGGSGGGAGGGGGDNPCKQYVNMLLGIKM